MAEKLNYSAAVIVASDKGAAGVREDTSGPAIAQILDGTSIQVVEISIVPDEIERISAAIVKAVDLKRCDLVITSGGTGLSPRDITPEATKQVIDYEVPGLAEGMRAAGMQHTPRAMLSRGIVGVRNFSLIINLPGSKKAVEENLTAILPVLGHALEVLRGAAIDCGRPD